MPRLERAGLMPVKGAGLCGQFGAGRVCTLLPTAGRRQRKCISYRSAMRPSRSSSPVRHRALAQGRGAQGRGAAEQARSRRAMTGAHARVIDLLWHLPVARDRPRRQPRISDAKIGELATLEVTVTEHRPGGGRRGGARALQGPGRGCIGRRLRARLFQCRSGLSQAPAAGGQPSASSPASSNPMTAGCRCRTPTMWWRWTRRRRARRAAARCTSRSIR